MKPTMKGLDRLLLAAMVTLGVSISYAGQESRPVPISRPDGRPVANINLAGTRVYTSTGTNTGIVAATGAGLVYWVRLSSGPTTTDSYTTIRDSATVNTTSALLLIPLVNANANYGTLYDFSSAPVRFSRALQVLTYFSSTTVSVGYTLDSDR